MFESAYDLKNFYSSRAGRLIRRLVTGHLREMWPDVSGQKLMGFGYSLPYLRPFMAEAERTFAVMPSAAGVHAWPPHSAGQVCLSGETDLPLESESVDRILMVHALEASLVPVELMQEIWRVLKSDGRLLVVVPNRLGLWARAEWTPFGHGRPYTARQLNDFLSDCLFVPERSERALFMPPFKSFLVLRTAYTLEGFGQFVFPGLAGVHLIEASKRIYAGAARSSRVKERRRVFVIGDTVPTG